MNLPSTIVIPAELVTAAENTGLAADGVQSLKDSYAPHFVKFHEIAAAARDVTIGAPKKAREMRLELKAIRVAADKTRKALKEDSLRRGKAIDGICAVLEYQLVPIEKAMEEIERAEELAEAKRVEAIKVERAAALAPYITDSSFYDLGGMPAGQWENLLAGAKAAHEHKAAAAAKAEADRVAAEKAAAEAKAKREAEEVAERERMRAENERLARIAAEEQAKREAAEATAKAEREAIQRKMDAEREQARKEREEAEAKAKAERESLERQAAADRAQAEHDAKLEREKRQAAEAIVRRQNEAEAKRVADAERAAKKAAAAPDKAKVVALAAAVRALAVPKLTTEAAKPLTNRIAEQVTKFAAWLDSEAAKL